MDGVSVYVTEWRQREHPGGAWGTWRAGGTFFKRTEANEKAISTLQGGWVIANADGDEFAWNRETRVIELFAEPRA